MSKTTFDDVVQQALRQLPSRYASALEEVAIEVRDQPTATMLRHAGIGEEELLLGLYEGIPLTERSVELPTKMPDRIFLFRGPIEEVSQTRDEAVGNIRVTLLHEIGHYFGLDEDDLESLGYA